ncbi:DUF1674 domain-containing protein [Fulvimarina endophytica]|uniref:DUF1674 domain-containing protein n=1 Tax=Fulvimarina endophytica TaxID=2293836 RepID=A0A371X065_9HYPH|nr:DUF1674 domain-containing protein [Fulvimarina endophytica]RFC62596.1 DUF1674 domain-containing protein [Fulvimarina endophytica]
MAEDGTNDILNALKVSSETNVKALSPAAKRALAEAEERRRANEAFKVDPDSLPPEVDGRKSGVEPVRYGDWEKDGIVSDF